MKSHLCKLTWVSITASFLSLLSGVCSAAPNVWTNSGDGAWEGAANWSLGTPSNTDSIFITYNGNYTVNINNTTADTGSTSTWMQVSSLAVGAAAGQPTLLIDFTNAARVLNLSSTGTGALNLGNASGRNGLLVLANGQFNVNAITSGAIINSQIGNTGQGTRSEEHTSELQSPYVI